MRTTKIFYVLLLLTIALKVTSQTAYYVQTDTSKKFCFTSYEMNYWLTSGFNSTAYKQVIDSLKAEVTNLKSDVDKLKVLSDSSERLLKTKDETVAAIKALSDEHEATSKKESKLKKFWRGLSGILGIGVLVESGLIYISK